MLLIILTHLYLSKVYSGLLVVEVFLLKSKTSEYCVHQCKCISYSQTIFYAYFLQGKLRNNTPIKVLGAQIHILFLCSAAVMSDVPCSRAVTNDYVHYQLTCWLFFN